MKLTRADKIVSRISIGIILLPLLWSDVWITIVGNNRILWFIVARLIFEIALVVMLFIRNIKIRYLLLMLAVNLALMFLPNYIN